MILSTKKYSFVIFLIITTIVSSIIFLGPNYHHYPSSGFKDLALIGAHWGFSTLGLFVVITILSLNRYIYLVLFPVFALITSVTAYFTWQIDVSINSALIKSILLTNPGEVSNYISWSLVLFVVIVLCLSVLSAFFRFRIALTRKQLFPLIIMLLVSATLFVFVNTKRYNTLMARTPFSYYLAIDTYLSDIEEMQKNRLMLGGGSMCEENDSLITLLIIGEALRADHLQMNGYHRETMPRMEHRGVVSLPNIFSPYTHTAASLRYFLTRAREDFPEPMFEESSFIDVFSECGFHSAWLGNQNPITSFRFFMNECDTVFINKPQFSDYSNTQKLDSDLIAPFDSLINKGREKQLAIIHIAGNHWWYNNNLPDDFVIFTPMLENKTLSVLNRKRMINSYDNVTRFVDSVIDRMIASVEDKNVIIIFLSDHGQSFGEDGKWLHANDMPAEQNPAAFIWLSDKYKKVNPVKASNILKNRNKYIDTSFLFHTILDGSNIKSPYLDASLSLFSDPLSLLKKEDDCLKKE